MESFPELLTELNLRLRDSLLKAGVEPVLSGNLCYDHLEPEFWKKPPIPALERKRELLRRAALEVESGTGLEVGVNGGHSLLLMLCANPELRFIGVDMCLQTNPGWGHVEIYVEEGIRFLQERFPGRIEFRKGDSLRVLYELDAPLRLVHLDGAKKNYEIELRIVQHLIQPDGVLVLDDLDVPVVKRLCDRLLRSGHFERILETPAEDRFQNVALRLREALPASLIRRLGPAGARAAKGVRKVRRLIRGV